MARQEQDREDILREATALVERAEVQTELCIEPVVVGFRANDALSLFLGQDEVYHFTSGLELRRGYLHGRLLKAESGRLVTLVRVRTTTETQLQRHVLKDQEQSKLLDQTRQRLQDLLRALDSGHFAVTGAVTANGANVLAKVKQQLRRLPSPLRVASSPRVQ